MIRTAHNRRGHNGEQSETTEKKFQPPESVALAAQNAQHLLHANNFLNKKILIKCKITSSPLTNPVITKKKNNLEEKTSIPLYTNLFFDLKTNSIEP